MKTALIPLALLAFALPASSQPSKLVNARLSVQPAAAGDPDAALKGLDAGPLWAAWEIATEDTQSHRCCYSNIDHAQSRHFCCGGCRLEGVESGFVSGDGKTLEPEERRLFLFARLEGGRLDKLRTFSTDCTLDAGGLPVVWLTGVAAEKSLAFLERLLEQRRAGRDLREQALMALAAHSGGAAVLVRLARRHEDPHIRGQALFWLAQVASAKAVPAIGEAVEHDPDTDVKVHAVFALTQLPGNEGVPHLIRLARTHKNSEVRRRSVFWLGQSHDPRALTFLEELVSR